MMSAVIRIQKKIRDLLNKESQGYEIELLEELAQFVNSLSPYEVINDNQSCRFVLRHKKTLKVIED